MAVLEMAFRARKVFGTFEKRALDRSAYLPTNKLKGGVLSKKPWC